MLAALAIVSGLLLAGAGGELLVRAVVAIAARARVPARAVATTVVAFATSAPELAVSTTAAVAGRPAIGLGDSLGSNVTNVGLALGIALAVTRGGIDRVAAPRDVGVAFAAPLLTAVLVLDGRLGRVDAAVLLAVFVAWLVRTIVVERRLRPAAAGRAEPSRVAAYALGALGLLMLVAAGRLVAAGAVDVGDALGLDPFVVGATFVALGTSLPDIATALVAGARGRHDVGFGTILGSNIFNGLLIVGVTALIHPIPVRQAEVIVTLAFGVALAALLLPGRGARYPRWRAFLLLGGYAAYVAVLAATGAAP